MKYRVIGYTDYDWPDFADGENSDAAIEAIIEDIKKHGYCFSGYAHQEYDNCVPVLNDGLARRFSQRGWGGVMARANGFTGYMDYSSFAFSFGYEEEKTPPLSRYITPDEVENIVSADSFSVELSSGALAAALSKGELELSDTPEYKKLECGDVLVLFSNSKTVVCTVKDYERGWHIKDKGGARVIWQDELFKLLYVAKGRKKEYAERAYREGTKVLKIYFEIKNN